MIMGFQDKLRYYRERSGISGKDFAAQLGIKYGTYNSYESAGKEPKYDTLCKIAAALHVSIDELLDYQPNKIEYWATYIELSMGWPVIYSADVVCFYPNEKLDQFKKAWESAGSVEPKGPCLNIPAASFISLMESIHKAVRTKFQELQDKETVNYFRAFITKIILEDKNLNDKERFTLLQNVLSNDDITINPPPQN